MKRILVALDGSANTDNVLARSIEQAKALGAKLRLLTVVPVPTSPPSGVVLTDNVDVLLDAARRALVSWTELVPEELRDGFMVELGSPSSGILRAADAYEPDLVVIGAHGYGTVARLLGTVASRVVNRIDRPVLVVRPLPAARQRPAGVRSEAGMAGRERSAEAALRARAQDAKAGA